MPAPATTYMIASTMRTRSYLLCEGMEATVRVSATWDAMMEEWQQRVDAEFQNRDAFCTKKVAVARRRDGASRRAMLTLKDTFAHHDLFRH